MSRRFRTGFAAILIALTAFFALLAAEAQQAAQNPRIALVIGNATYRDAALATPANDAGLVAQTLQAAGFDVVGARDLDGQSLRTAFRDFLQKAAAAGPDMQAFVYLAGRAVQYNGDNYFVPVDARINRDADVPIEAIRMSDFTHALAATPGRARIIVLDAARANPYAAQGAPLAPGLALVDPEPGELIAFNAAPGTLAGDEEGPYGVYTKTLAGAIRQGGVDIAQAFDQTRVSVNAETQGALLPFSASRLGGPFYVFERAADAPPPGPSLAETERQPLSSLSAADAYAAALERDTIKGYREFLAAYPKSDQARRVRAILAVRREAAYWRRTVGADTPRAYWTYLQTYPKGPHVADARRRLAMLSAEFEPPPDFRPERFADLPPPPPDERFYEERPIYAFDDFGPPPPPPAEQYVYVEDDDWRDLPPPPPPPQIGVLPVLGVALPIAIGAVAYQGLFHRNGIAPQGAPHFRPRPPGPPPLPANIKPQAPPQPAAAASAAANGAVVKPLPPIGRRGRPGAPAAAPGNPAVAVPPAALPAGKTNPPPGAAALPAVRVAPGGNPLPASTAPVAPATGGKPPAATPSPAAAAPAAPANPAAPAPKPLPVPPTPGNPAVAVPPAALPAGKTNPPPGAAALPAVRVAPGGKPLPAPTAPVAPATGGKPLPAAAQPPAPAGAPAPKPDVVSKPPAAAPAAPRPALPAVHAPAPAAAAPVAPRPTPPAVHARAPAAAAPVAPRPTPPAVHAPAPAAAAPVAPRPTPPAVHAPAPAAAAPVAPRPTFPAVHAPAPAAAAPAAPRPAPPAVHAPAPVVAAPPAVHAPAPAQLRACGKPGLPPCPK